MEIKDWEVTFPIELDIVAENAQGQPILLVEAKATKARPAGILQVTSYLQAITPPVPFGMLVDLDDILIFRRDAEEPSKPICTLKTADVLRHYDPEFDQKPIYEFYLATLVEAWLDDLAFHWKFETPPASEELAAIGLLPLLEGGSTQNKVMVGDRRW